MNTTDKLAEALRLAREWFRHEEAGEGPQADAVIKAADEALAADDAEQAAKAVPAGFVLVPMCSDHAVSHAVNQARSESHKQGDAAFQQAFARAIWRQFNAMLAAAPTPPAPEAQQALASDWSWTTVRMELEASGRDDLSAWVSQQIEPKAHAGEPVVPYLYVYEYDSPFGLNREFYPSGWNGQKPTRTVPLYTTPQPAQAPERVGLTDSKIDDLSHEMVKGGKSVNWLARAIERAHGIGATTGKEPGNV